MSYSTVSGNSAHFAGGAWFGDSGSFGYESDSTIRNSTISGNTAMIGAGGLVTQDALLKVWNSTIAFNNAISAERAGDFSQTLDNNGALFPYIKDPTLTGVCSASDQTACFRDGGVVGKIPANRLYPVGTAILSRYPLPNRTQTPGSNYNYELGGTGAEPLPLVNQLRQQPALRIDYQASAKLRITGIGRQPLVCLGQCIGCLASADELRDLGVVIGVDEASAQECAQCQQTQ
jgi:hypothetical protein